KAKTPALGRAGLRGGRCAAPAKNLPAGKSPLLLLRYRKRSVPVGIHLLVLRRRGVGGTGRRAGGADGRGRTRTRDFTGQAGHLATDGLAEQAVHADRGHGDQGHDDDVFGHALAALGAQVVEQLPHGRTPWIRNKKGETRFWPMILAAE